MARKPRIEFEGAFYHVLTRGNQKQKIFRDTGDFQKYLDILAKYKDKYKYYLYAYILMNNHVHLLIETQKVPLSKILQGVSQSYTLHFNRRYKTVGHLFQGRYKAILCDRDEYLLALIKYIHLNPVRAGIVKTPDEYQWSSQHKYAEKTDGRDIIDTDQVLMMFSEDKTTARKLYREYMGDGLSAKKDDIYSTIDQRILGNERFVDKVMENYDASIEPGRRNKEYKLSEIAAGIEEAYGITLKEIRGKGKGRDISLGRKLMSLTAKEYGHRGKEIAEFTKKDPAIVTRHLRERDRLRKETEKVIGILSEKRLKCQ